MRRALLPLTGLMIFVACTTADSNSSTDASVPREDAATTHQDATTNNNDATNTNEDATHNNEDANTTPQDATTTADAGTPPDCVEPANAIRVTTTIQAALDTANAGDTVVVPTGTYSELVVFPRSGTAGAPITLMAACDATVLIDGTGLGAAVSEPALITADNQSHLVIRGFELANLAGTNGNFPAGIWVRGASSDITIRNNVVHKIRAENGGDNSGAHGIGVYGTSPTPAEDIRVLDNELFDLTLGWSEALVINGNVRRFEVRANTVHDVNNIAFDFIGFESDVCPNCSQADTTAGDVNRARDGVVADNTAYAMTTAGNPAYGDEKSAACYYVDGGADIVIEKNVAHDCDLGVELASEHFDKSTARVIVRNNFLYSNDVTGISTGGYDSSTGAGGGSAVDCAIVNNTIADSSRDGWANTGLLLQNRNQNNIYKNNIIIASPGMSVASDGGALNTNNIFDSNIYFMGDLDGIEPGASSQTVDPRLANAATGDLHLLDNSPAIDRGEALTESGTEDIDGDARIENVIDVGADEHR